MLMIPGLSLLSVSLAKAAIESAYSIFNEEYTVYVFDGPEVIDETADLFDAAHDIYGMISELGLKDIYLFGVSAGGMISQVLALEHPELFRKMVLCSTTDGDVNNEKFRIWHEYAKKKDLIALIDSFMKNVYSPEVYKANLDSAIMVYKNLSDEDFKYFLIKLKACREFDLKDRVSEIKVPTLVIGSRKDQIYSSELMEDMAKRIGCDSYFYEGYSHAVYDEAEDFKKRVYDFYKQD